MKFLVTADLHVNQTIMSTPDVRAGMPDTWVEAFARLREIVEVANDRHVDYIIVAGDLFDDGHPTPENVALTKEAFSASHAPVVILGGNHDYSGITGHHRTPSEVYLGDQAWCAGVYVETGVVDLDGFKLATIPWWRVAGTDSLNTDSDALDKEVRRMADALSEPSLLVGHLTVAEADFRQKAFRSAENLIRDAVLEALVPSATLDAGPWSAALLGHIHRAQAFTDKVRYVGSSYPITFGETAYVDGFKGVEIIDIEEDGTCTHERVALDHRHMDIVDLSESPSSRAIHTSLDAGIAPIGREYRAGDRLQIVLDHSQNITQQEASVIDDLASRGVRVLTKHKPDDSINPSLVLGGQQVAAPSDIANMTPEETLEKFLDKSVEDDARRSRLLNLFADTVSGSE